MPVDAALIPRLRVDVLDELEADYVTVDAMYFFAAELVGVDNHATIRELVLETAVGMLDDPAAKVVDGPMRYTFSDADELRRHFESMWPRGHRHQQYGGIIFWIVEREDDLGNSASVPSSGFEDA